MHTLPGVTQVLNEQKSPSSQQTSPQAWSSLGQHRSPTHTPPWSAQSRPHCTPLVVPLEAVPVSPVGSPVGAAVVGAPVEVAAVESLVAVPLALSLAVTSSPVSLVGKVALVGPGVVTVELLLLLPPSAVVCPSSPHAAHTAAPRMIQRCMVIGAG
jgi:hypothetical protein